MTGFGRGRCERDGREFTVEIKSVNSRYCDVSVHLPVQISYLEDRIRKYILGSISRGKIDVYIAQDKYSRDDVNVSVDYALTEAYLKALAKLQDRFRLEDDITVSLVSKMPDVLTVERVGDDEDAVWQSVADAIDESLRELIEMRTTEGQKLAEDIEKRAGFIRSVVKRIEDRSPEVVSEYRNRLEDRIKTILGDIPVDQTRLAQEVAIFADKSSIDEEVVRLYSHLDQLSAILSEDEPVGRKLDFLVQEMNREINTIGSKASDLDITNNVVEVKSEIEKIREQVQNIE